MMECICVIYRNKHPLYFHNRHVSTILIVSFMTAICKGVVYENGRTTGRESRLSVAGSLSDRHPL